MPVPIRHLRFVVFLATMAAVFLSALFLSRLPVAEAFIAGFDAGALVFIASAVPAWLHDRPVADRRTGADDDGGLLLRPVVALLATLAVLCAVVVMIGARDSLGGAGAASIAATLALAWLFVNLELAFHYARIEAEGAPRIAFPDDHPRTFADYVYFSFVIGMTCQTADAAIASSRLRRLATLHGIGTFFFNLGILALAVNVLSGVL